MKIPHEVFKTLDALTQNKILLARRFQIPVIWLPSDKCLIVAEQEILAVNDGSEKDLPQFELVNNWINVTDWSMFRFVRWTLVQAGASLDQGEYL